MARAGRFVTPEEHFAAICEAFLDHQGVSQPAATAGRKAFGSSALRVHHKIFAMLVKGRLVVKLSADRVDALIASGAGQRYEPRPGRLMKEWVSLDLESAETSLSLAREALKFVGGGAD